MRNDGQSCHKSAGMPSGLIEITSETIAKMHSDDHPPHPTWLEL